MDVYTARVLEAIDNGPNYGKHLRVGVFRGEGDDAEKIGEYVRNYSQFYNTFCPFQQNGKAYALYSPNYTATRLMELPSCRDIGGEEPGGQFCPTDYYVPFYAEKIVDGRTRRIADPSWEQLETFGVQEVIYYPFGFVGGRVWAADWDTKIQYADLTEVARGILHRDDRFGHTVVANTRRLRDAISFSAVSWLPDHVQITHDAIFNTRTGASVDPYDVG